MPADDLPPHPYRDAPPSETIGRVRAVLDDLGLRMHERGWRDVDGLAYSVSIAASAFSLPERQRAFGANGKGTTPELALASAYAEFAERLQNLHPTCFFGSYGEMPGQVEPPDLVRKTLGELRDGTPETVDHLFTAEAIAALATEVVPCLPFYGVRLDRVTWVPEAALSAVCESNGTCAGNTPAEALVHGLAEVCERHVAREAFRRRLVLPTIPAPQLERLSGYRILRVVEAAGYRVIVKDGSLGGRYPVLGVILVDPTRTSYHVHFGASLSLDIALQRCLTEAFQGASLGDNPRLKPLVWDDAAYGFVPRGDGRPLLRERVAWRNFVGDGTGETPTSLLVSAGVPRYEAAFESTFSSTRTSLAFMLELLGRSGHSVLIRDVSFLGFPAFRVYVPGMSEIHDPLDEARLDLFTRRLPRARATLLSLRTADEASLRACVQTLEDLLTDIRYESWSLIPRVCQVVFGPASDLARLYEPKLLLALLHHRLGDDRRAAEAFRRYLFDPAPHAGADGDPRTSIAHGPEALAFHSLTASGRDDPVVRETLHALFGEERAREALDEFRRREAAFDRYRLPHCGDCETCDAVADCQYSVWRALAERVQQRLLGRPIDQGAVGRLMELPRAD